MPIYEYRCQSCGHEQEVLQKVSDPLLSDCPVCKAPTLKKKISAAGFRLKGGGWYETDFKSGNKKNVVGDKSASSSDDAGKSTSKEGGDKAAASTDKKTETKTDSTSASKSTGGSAGTSA
jgi:putative FmdB family regulatory protein